MPQHARNYPANSGALVAALCLVASTTVCKTNSSTVGGSMQQHSAAAPQQVLRQQQLRQQHRRGSVVSPAPHQHLHRIGCCSTVTVAAVASAPESYHQHQHQHASYWLRAWCVTVAAVASAPGLSGGGSGGVTILGSEDESVVDLLQSWRRHRTKSKPEEVTQRLTRKQRAFEDAAGASKTLIFSSGR